MTIKRKIGDRTVEIGPIGPDVDLDEEEFYTADGRRLTEALAREIAEEAIRKVGRGRPSMTGQAAPTPNLTIRVPPALRASLQRIADAQGRRVAEVGRDALTEYARRHGRTKVAAKPVAKKTAAKAVVKKAAPRKRASAS